MAFDPVDSEEAAVAFGILSEGKPLPKELVARSVPAKRVRADIIALTLLDPDVMTVAATVARKGAKA